MSQTSFGIRSIKSIYVLSSYNFGPQNWILRGIDVRLQAQEKVMKWREGGENSSHLLVFLCKLLCKIWTVENSGVLNTSLYINNYWCTLLNLEERVFQWQKKRASSVAWQVVTRNKQLYRGEEELAVRSICALWHGPIAAAGTDTQEPNSRRRQRRRQGGRSGRGRVEPSIRVLTVSRQWVSGPPLLAVLLTSPAAQ